MAATTSIISTPDYLSPVNDEFGNYWTLYNSSFSLTNFKYICRLNQVTFPSVSTPTFTYLSQELIPPRPINGYGIYSPFKTLLTLLSYDLHYGMTFGALSGTGTMSNATQSANGLVCYGLQYGIQYNPDLTITTLLQVPAGSTPSYFGFSFSTAHNFNVGDIITTQTQNPYFAGTAAVTQILTTTSIKTDRLFSTASVVSSGVVTNLQRIDGTSSYFWGYNGSRLYNEVNVNFYYELTQGITASIVTSQPFLTEYPQTQQKLILSNQAETLSVMLNRNGFSGPTAGFTTFKYYNSSNSLLSTQTYSFVVGNGSSGPQQPLQKWDIPVGTNNPYMPLTTDYYTVVFGKSAGVTYSEIRTFKIDTSCSIYDNVRVMWLNRYGSWDYFNFRLDNKKVFNISRNEYKQELQFGYSVGARERTILSQKVTEQHIINTNWLSESEYEFMSSLIVSPEVYIIDETTNLTYPIIVVDTNFEFKTYNRDKLFNFTLTYETSYEYRTLKQ